MTTELLSLLVLVLLALALPLFYSILYGFQVGLSGLLGNRENLPEPAGMAGRGVRAHRNLLENLVPYAAVILAAKALGVSNATTMTAAEIFAAARILHALSYIAGIPVVRTLTYAAGLAATLAILAQLFG